MRKWRIKTCYLCGRQRPRRKVTRHVLGGCWHCRDEDACYRVWMIKRSLDRMDADHAAAGRALAAEREHYLRRLRGQL